MNQTPHINDSAFDFLLQSFAADTGATLPAVIWRADLVKNEINFLNEHVIPGLEEGVAQLLQDAAGAEEMLAEDDRSVFARFQERLHQRQPVSEVIRARGRDGVMRWLYILGSPDPEMTFCYIGLLADCTSLANAILKRGSQAGLAEHVELFSNPVFMVHVGSRQVVAANEAARIRLGIDPDERQTGVADLLAGNPDAYLRDIYERLLFDLSWNGLLEIRTATGETLACTARVRAYDRDGRHLLWFSLTPRHQAAVAEPAARPVLCKDGQRRLKSAKSLADLLTVILDHQPETGRADAALLSQIFISKGNVIVTGVGAAFKDIQKNNTHPYPGSIAENIVLYNLDHLIVEDTSKSIKPIDWALFIPHGIRSYFAVPFFHENVLRDVVIFCSTTPNAFSPDNIQPYLGLAESLWPHLPRIVGDLTQQRTPA
ncbi:GAF domain-containing protein [Rhodobium gokarnense]|uniref:PAS domain-containing protein n=1 Tax=Rhodobium gokarnense TaxID=364296 RepID=A0ABT3HGW9_9HYPH|nr:GAF domain-containing protein [Rhodobium gokarnense]MCW2309620.1 PAS domain-containing protein [Rhodobium gokarnense]